ncbi:Enoyl-CoA hydratase [hydrothermal vent metagenome]|uniref:Enoyl-CoA hydratase n=1 Tax=hydrothermal vent metagenome TaxID=652676 RepID=A0A3B0VRP6_9ZZZZ
MFTDSPIYETITCNVDDQVLLITMNRPERRNALNDALNRDLLAAFTYAGDEDAIRAIVLTGEGKGFCAGADLSGFGAQPTAEQVYDTILASYQPLMGLITTIEKPVIAAVNGIAAGAGASLALACDLLMMADDASLMMAFSNIGLVPDAGACWFLQRQVGYSRAYQIAIEGEQIPATDCLTYGLVNKVVPAAALLVEAQVWAAKLAKRPTLALGLTKHALNHAAANDLASTIEYEARLQKQTIPSHDHKEGVRAFAERRPPKLTGR